ncbi:hypothetical protein ACFFRR_007074 [Megaselia abdita]
MKTVILILAVSATFFNTATAGICDLKCDGTQAITCTGIDTFQRCDSNNPRPQTISCTGGFVCSSGSLDWCVDPKTTRTDIDCENACNGVCPSGSSPGNPTEVKFGHVCIGPNTYRLCSSFYPIDRTCPDGQVCTLANKCDSPDAAPLCG